MEAAMSGDLGPEARGILDAGRDGDDPTPGDRARVRASLMQAIAVGGGAAVGLGAIGKASASVAPKAAAGAAAAAKTVTTFGVAKLIGVVAVVAVVGGGGYTISRVSSRPAAAPPAQVAERQQIQERAASVAAPAGVAPQARVADAPEPAPEAQPESAETPRAATERAPAARAVAPVAPPSAPESDPLSVETRQIREANLARQAGDARRALAILDKPAPGSDGQMSEERTVARVLALCSLGRVDQAKAIASRFVAEHPSSPSVDRMQHPCVEDR
jgi:hypothetical protein